MNIALWVVAGLLALVFIAAGVMKLAKSKEQILSSGMKWAEGFSPAGIKVIGLLEILGALGLVLPGLTGIAAPLVAVAALALGVMMAVAVAVEIRAKQPFVPALVLCILSLLLGIGRLIVAF